MKDTETLITALICCDNKNPLLTCSDCPYEKYDDCFKRLILECKNYLSNKDNDEIKGK